MKRLRIPALLAFVATTFGACAAGDSNFTNLVASGDITAAGNLAVTGTTALTGAPTVTGDLSLEGGAGALTMTTASSSVLVTDNSATGLVLGSTGVLNLLTMVTTDNAEQLIVTGGLQVNTTAVTGAVTLGADECGNVMMTTAAIDTATVTLPATVAGCVYTLMYTGADGGALLDISPNASDAIHGSCTLAASVLEFNGTDDNDIGLTKATANTGDTITLAGDGTEGWYVTTCTGIWANN